MKVPLEDARNLINNIAKELNLNVSETSGFIKIQGVNKHRLYVQVARYIGRIDFTYDLPQDSPGRKPLNNVNGSIKCSVVPTLEYIEMCLRILGDSSIEHHKINKPAPFSAGRKIKVMDKIPDVVVEETEEQRQFKSRIQAIKSRAREVKILRVLDNPEVYGEMSWDDAAVIVDNGVNLHHIEDQFRAKILEDVSSLKIESGIPI